MSQPPLSDEELAKLRAILANDAHMVWLWAMLRRYGGAVAALLAGFLALRDDIRALVLGFMGKS